MPGKGGGGATHRVAAPPVQEVEVVVVHHVGGVQDLLRSLREGPEGLLLWPLPQVLGVDAHVALVPRRGRRRLQHEGIRLSGWNADSVVRCNPHPPPLYGLHLPA